MKIILLITSVACLFYCCSNNDRDASGKLIQRSDESNFKNKDSIEHAIEINDTVFYGESAALFRLHNMQGDFLFYALKMAYRNNYPDAYYHIYDFIAYSTPKSSKDAIKLMDNKSKNFALYHLLKSYEMGYSRAIYEINEVFDKPKEIPSSQYYLNELTKEYSR